MSTATAAPTPSLTLDCRRVRPERLAATVLDTFDSLLPGERLRVVCESAPAAILASLQRERRGAFEWSPAREGPARWEVDIERRDAAPSALRTVREAMTWDHERLSALEEAAFAARHDHDYGEAARRYAVF